MISKVLLVDDNDQQHELYDCYASVCEDIQLLHAVSLSDALVSMQKNELDIVLLDNQLAPYSCYKQTVPEIRNAGFEGRIVVITAEIRTIIRSEARDSTVHDFIDKFDVNITNFNDKVLSYLN